MRPQTIWISLFVLCALLSAGRASAQYRLTICGGSNSPVDIPCRGERGPLESFGLPTGIVVGDEVASVALEDVNTGQKDIIIVGVGRYALPIPDASGWSAPATIGDPPVPPSTASPVIKWQCPSISASYPTCAALAPPNDVTDKDTVGVAHCAWAGGPAIGRQFTGWVGTYNDVPNCNGYTNSNWRIQGRNTCAAGYTPVSNYCSLNDASVVEQPSDNIVVSSRSGNVFFLGETDPDNGSGSTTAATALSVSASGDTATAGNASKGGVVSVTAGAGGTTTITFSRDLGNGTTGITSVNVGAPDGTGKASVTGVATSVVEGTGDLAGTPLGKTTVEGSCGGTGQPKCAVQVDETGTDFSAAASAQESASTAYSALQGQIDAAKASGAASDLVPGLPDLSLPTVVGPEATSFWNPFPAIGACQPLQGPTSGRLAGLSLDICPVLDALRPVLEWGLYLLTMIVIWQMWFNQENMIRT